MNVIKRTPEVTWSRIWSVSGDPSFFLLGYPKSHLTGPKGFPDHHSDSVIKSQPCWSFN